MTRPSLNRSFTIKHTVSLPLRRHSCTQSQLATSVKCHSDLIPYLARGSLGTRARARPVDARSTFLIMDIMKALKCKPSASFAYSYSINILSKYTSLILHRPSMFEGRHIDYRSSKIDTSITDLRRSTHRSSVFKGQHIHLRRSAHRSSEVDTSISEGQHIV